MASLLRRVKWFRVASSVSLLPVFVCIFPLRLLILCDQERLQNVTDTVGIHLYGGVYSTLRGSSKIHVLQSLVCIIRFAAVSAAHSWPLRGKVNVPLYGPSDGDVELQVFFMKHSSKERSASLTPNIFFFYHLIEFILQGL